MTTTFSPEDRVLRRTAPTEMARRWELVRKHMQSNGLDAIVALGSDDFIGGHLRWLSDRVATNAYHSVALFYADAPMTLIEHGGLQGHRDVTDQPDFPGAADLYTTTSWRSVASTHRNEAEIALRELKRRGCRRVGTLGGGGMPHAFAAALAGAFDVVDATDFVDRCKAIKSPAEITEIKLTAALQDAVFKALLGKIEPGMRDLDIMAIAQCEGRRLGSEQGVFLVSSQRPGKPTLLMPPHFQGRTTQHGDHVTVLIENNGPTGYYTELGRTIVFGKATGELRDSMALAVAAQRNTLERLRPGVACADIAHAHDEFLLAHGLERETRLYAHGQGYDLVERPLVRADNNSLVEAGMNIVVHPSFVLNSAFGYVCDNFIVRPNGPPEPIHQTEQRIFEL